MLVDRLGFGYYSFLVARLAKPAAGRAAAPFYTASYPDEWRQRYTARNYHFYDPVVVTSATQRSPFQWGGGRYLRRFRKRQRRVFDEAGPFGIKYGVTIPVHGPQSEFSLLTISVDRNDSHFRDAMEASIGELQLLAYAAHDIVTSQFVPYEIDAETELSDIELECLYWTAQGKTSADIAAILNRSVPTVNYHFAKAARKMNAVNKFQAAITAYRLRLLN